MKNAVKRSLAFLLCLVMLVSNVPAGAVAFADNEAEGETAQTIESAVSADSSAANTPKTTETSQNTDTPKTTEAPQTTEKPVGEKTPDASGDVSNQASEKVMLLAAEACTHPYDKSVSITVEKALCEHISGTGGLRVCGVCGAFLHTEGWNGSSITSNNTAITPHYSGDALTWVELSCAQCNASMKACAGGHKAGADGVCTVCGDGAAEPPQQCEHVWNDGEVTTAATCTTDGVKTYTCTNEGCAETKTEPITATGHKWNDGEVTTAATCTTDGVKTYSCTNEGCAETKTEPITAAGHKWNDGEVTTAATCTTDGVKTYTCTNEGCAETKTEPIAAGHKWDDGEVTTAATCTTDGEKTYSCTNEGCTETKTEPITAAGHQWGDDNKCTVCGERAPTALDAAIIEAANAYFAEAENALVVDTYRVDENVPYAGGSLTYHVGIGFGEAPNWNGDDASYQPYDSDLPLYKSYENSKVVIELPAGIILQGITEGYSVSLISDVDPYDTEAPHTYEVTLNNIESDSSSDTGFDLVLYITGNGTEDAVYDYDCPLKVKVTSELKPFNHRTNDPAKNADGTDAVIRLEAVPEAPVPPISVDTIDNWGVIKTAKSATLDNAANPTKVEVVYEVNVGLINGNVSDNKALISDINQYEALTSRDELTTITLTDSMTAFVKGTDTALTQIGDATITKLDANRNPIAASETVLSNEAVNLNFSTAPEAAENPLGLNTINVDSNGDNTKDMPTGVFTSYLVKVTYAVDASMIKTFNEGAAVLDFDNSAELNYQLAKKPARSDNSKDGIDKTLPISTPATLTVDKKLGTSSGEKDYKSDGYETKYGEISYKVFSADGGIVFTKNGEDYTEVEKADDGAFVVVEGVTYYLLPGHTYAIAEALTSEQSGHMVYVSGAGSYTAVSGGSWAPVIKNNETIGKITVKKVDEKNGPLDGAVFELRDAEGNIVGEPQTTAKVGGVSGIAVFDNLSYGSYTLVETQAPVGYKLPANPSVSVTLNKPIADTIVVTNNKNSALVKLTKNIATYGAFSAADDTFLGVFELQRSVNGGEYETVTKDIYNQTIATAVDRNGSISAVVDARDENDNIYTYRFVETTIPEGFYNPTAPESTLVYSAEKTLFNGTALNPTTEFEINNRQKVSAVVTKEYFTVGANGKTTPIENMFADVTLYKFDGTNLEAVGTKTTTAHEGSTTKSSTGWDNLLPVDSNGNKLSYYIKETSVEGYRLENSTETVAGVDGLIKILDENSGLTGIVNLKNVRQIYPVVVVKRNDYTKAWDSAFANQVGFTVKDAGSNVVSDAKSASNLSDVLISQEAGSVIYLEPGQKYYLTETVNNTGYKQINATADNPIEIDLTNPQAVTTGGTNVITLTLLNRPDPGVKIAKKNTGSGNVSGAVFTVFTKNGDAYVPYQVNGTNVTISGNASTAVRLPVGEYYVAETTVPSGYINPNKVPAEYKALDSKYVEGTYNRETYLFYPLSVTEKTSTAAGDHIITLTLKNISNKTSVKILKNIDGKAATVGGFKINVLKGDAVVKSATTTTKTPGSVTISDLPIYDTTTWTKIEYTVKEANITGAMADTYYKVSDGQTFILNSGKTQTKDNSAAQKTLAVENATYTSAYVNKLSKHTWEFQYTNLYYNMAGVEIGLYKLDGDTYKFVESKITDSTGAVSFSKLERGTAYAVAEIASPDKSFYPATVNDARLELAPKGDIAASELVRYNSKTLPAETTPGARAANTNLGTLYNKDSWVQFDITKYIDNELLSDDHPHKTSNIVNGVEQSIDADDNKYNNAVFQLYRKEMGEDDVAASFDINSHDGWTLVGTYSSGSEYSEDNQAMAGQFRTDVDQKAADNVVYVLVETNVGPGGAILNPNFKYTVFQEKSKAYTITVAEAGFTARQQKYTLDQVNYDKLLNSKPQGEGGEILIAELRIAKWRDSYNAAGELSHEYQPLPNVEFTVALAETGDVLETLTVGLDEAASAVAGAQSAAYRLSENENGSYTLVSYANETGNTKEYNITNVVKLEDTASRTVYGVPVNISEVSAPEGFTYAGIDNVMYFCFVSLKNAAKNPVAVNDVYYVTSATAEVPLADAQVGIPAYATWEGGSYDNGGQYRIVDYPEIETIVIVEKYGYTPTADTLGKNSDALFADAGVESTPLGGITMTLEKKNTDGAYKPYDYDANEFTTNTAKSQFTVNDAGRFVFSKGLSAGDYRIYESDLGGHSADYENAYPASRPRMFTVAADTLIVRMYNPTRFSLSVEKKDVQGNIVTSGVSFKLNNTTVAVNNEGKAVFDNLVSNTYKLAESSNTLSVSYLTSYFAEKYPNYVNLVNGTGIKLGYDFETVNGDNVITAIRTIDNALSITVVDPSKGSLSIRKIEEGKTTKGLSGAKFELWYKPFEKWSGEIPVNPELTAANGWTKNANTETTDAQGKINKTELEPGIYALCEAEAPSGYDVITKPDGSKVAFYFVVKGGMDVTVNGLPETTAIKGTDAPVTTLFVDETATVDISNRIKVPVKAVKTVEAGQISADTLTWSITLNLYESISGGTPVGSVTFTNTNNPTEGLSFKTGSSDTLLSKGKTYYLEEVGNNFAFANEYVVEEVKVNGTVVSADGTRYPVTVGDVADIGIAVTNRYMAGRVIFNKVDANTHEAVEGAKFAVYTIQTVDGTEMLVPVANATVNSVADHPGIYVATIPLTGDINEKTQFTIKETEAPGHYVVTDTAKIEVKISAVENEIDWSELDTDKVDTYIENIKGYPLVINKYNNKYGVTNPAPAPVAANDASFTLYHLKNNSWQIVEEKATDADGKVEWLLIPGDSYAFAETRWSEKFLALESTRDHFNPGTALTLSDITVSGATVKVFTVPSEHEPANGEFVYDVYNTPKLEVKINKEDVGNYPENVIPISEFKIYELDELGENFGRADAEALVADGTPVYTNTTKKQQGSLVTTETWHGRNPEKYYVVIETSVGADAHTSYNQLNKDDKRVVWYATLEPIANPDPAAVEEVTLKNICGDAKVTMTKQVTEIDGEDVTGVTPPPKADSLLESGHKITVVSKPVVESHNQPLSSFVVTESPLGFEPPASTEYHIETIEIGPASHKTDNFINEVKDETVSAKITWKDADGNTISETTVDLNSESSVSVNAPAGENTASFEIEYFCEGVKTATDGAYVLGEDFTPGDVKVNYSVHRQPDGTAESPVAEIEKLVSPTSVELKYPAWDRTGSGTTEKTSSDEKSVEVLFDKLVFPVVSIAKSCDDSDHILTLKKELTTDFILTVTNNSDIADFIDPVVLDVLPTGVTYMAVKSIAYEGQDGAPELGYEVQRYVGAPTKEFIFDQERIPYGDPETAVVFKFTGALKPHAKMVITFTASVSDSVVLYGTEILNYVFLSSSYHTYHTVNNPQGYSFNVPSGSFPLDPNRTTLWDLDKEASYFPAPEHVIGDRLVGLENALEAYRSSDYIWTKEMHRDGVIGQNSVTLEKAIKGDQDVGFSSKDSFIATSTRTNSTPGDEKEGYVDYRLAVRNGSAQAIYNLGIGDVLPHVNYNNSKWTVIMDRITAISVAGVVPSADKYSIYYYVSDGTPAQAKTAVDNALKDIKLGQFNTADSKWGGAWRNAADVTDMLSVKAFVIYFKPGRETGVSLAPGTQMIVTFHARTPDITDDAEFAQIAFENANNTFNFIAAGVTQQLNSNLVKVQMTDGRVAVEGDVWIDEDWDATQGDYPATESKPGTNRRDYSEYAIIRQLINGLSFSIMDNRNTPGNVPKADVTKENTYSGESILHFTFKGLGAAQPMPREDEPLYVNNRLNTANLKTSDPYNYTISASLRSDLLSIFQLTDTGASSYMSDDMNQMSPMARAVSADFDVSNIWDSNFSGTNGNYSTLPFFLRYGVTDETKDIGFKMIRGLEITKLDEENNILGAGVKFSISGPFDEGTAAAGGNKLKFTLSDGVYTLDENGTETLLVTDANGKIKVDGLNWWKEYVITEEETLDGYSIAKATAAAAADTTSIEELEGSTGAWVLKIPGTDRLVKDDKITVNNPKPDETSEELKVKKVIDPYGQGMYPTEPKTFTFTLSPVSNAPMPEGTDETTNTKSVTITTQRGGDDAVASFGVVDFAKAGTYSYIVKETEETGTAYTGIVFDTAEHSVEITVAEGTGENKGKLTTSVKVDGKEVHTETAGAAISTVPITNRYVPTSTEIQLEASKSLTGSTRPTEKIFTFVLAPTATDGNTPMPADPQGAIKTVKGAGTVTFDKIVYTESGEWTYTVNEQKGNETGYTYDETIYSVAVTVTDNGGVLQATKVISKVGELGGAEVVEKCEFVNDYTPEPVKAAFEVNKLFDNTSHPRPDDNKKTFVFNLSAVSENAPMPELSTVEITDTGKESFGEITFKVAGTYVYSVSEEANDGAGFTCDKTVYTATVTVTDNNGKLEKTVKYTVGEAEKEAINFTNHYEPVPTSAVLPVKKTMSGNPLPEDKTFSFTLAGNNSAPMPAAGEEKTTITVKKNAVTGESEFGTISFKTAGTYTYTVNETKGTEYGIGYDEAVHTYKVVVTDNKGALEAKAYLDDETEAGGKANFNNTYKPDAIALSIPVEKQIKGNDTPEDMTFKFKLEAVTANAPMPAAGGANVTIIGEGKSAFGVITYEFAGEYQYKVSEIKGDDTGYTYDETVFNVTVTVEDVAGKLKLSYKVEKAEADTEVAAAAEVPETETAETIVFVNSYKPNPVEVVIPVEKIVSGDTPEDNDKTFLFTMSAVTKDAPMPEKNTVTITGNGKADFDKITFEAAGTYEYEIVETDGKETGYTYDIAVRTIIVTVTDNKGNLEASWTANREVVKSVAFTNSYKPNPVEVVLEATKILRNLRLKDNMFSFTLADEQGNIIETVANTANGNVSFSPITYDKVGVHTYYISEVRGTMYRTTYDTRTFKVTVVVSDNDGNLVATVEAPEAPVFINTYVPYIPKTGYGPENNGMLLALACGAIATLLGTGKKKNKRKTH